MKVRFGPPGNKHAAGEFTVDSFTASELLIVFFDDFYPPAAAISIAFYVQEKHAQLYVDGLPKLVFERID